MSKSMTPERAIEIITNVIQNETITEEKDMALAIAQKVFEYRTHKKPIENPTNSFFADLRCPDCNALIARNQKYCKNCGQALDWSDEE